jgi:hypothetical protein
MNMHLWPRPSTHIQIFSLKAHEVLWLLGCQRIHLSTACVHILPSDKWEVSGRTPIGVFSHNFNCLEICKAPLANSQLLQPLKVLNCRIFMLNLHTKKVTKLRKMCMQRFCYLLCSYRVCQQMWDGEYCQKGFSFWKNTPTLHCSLE